MRGRADLRATRGRPQHLLRPEEPSTVEERRARRGTGAGPRGHLEEELLRLRQAQAHQGGASSRPRLRSRAGGATHATPGDPRGLTGQASLHHPPRRYAPSRTRPRQQEVRRDASRPTLGGGLHLLLHVVRRRLRRLHHRRLLAASRRMEGVSLDDRRPRRRRAQHGGLDEAHQPRRCDVSHGRRQFSDHKTESLCAKFEIVRSMGATGSCLFTG